MGEIKFIRFVFGYSSSAKDHLFYIEENTVLYQAVTNVEQKSQRFLPVSEAGEQITAFTVAADRHVFAVAQISPIETSIHIYDLHTFRKRRKIVCSQLKSGSKFISLAFSADNKILVGQSDGADWLMLYFAWEKGKALAQVSSPPRANLAANQVTINPFDINEVCVCGNTFATNFRYSEGALIPRFLEIPQLNYVRHTWLSVDKILLGSSDGKLVLVQAGKLLKEETFNNGEQITSIQITQHGFAVAGTGGSIIIYNFLNTKGDEFAAAQKLNLPDPTQTVTTLSTTSGEDTLLIEVNNSQVYKVVLSQQESAKGLDSQPVYLQMDELKFELFLESFHTAEITGLDLCIRKPLIVTASADKSVRIWNYLTGVCELQKQFGDEPQSVALHPSGLYILVGFSDKLRLMNILIDDLRAVREFAIRACKECRFSNGGHVFAAANGNIVQIFSTWTFECIANLKGHNGRIKSIHWTPDDSSLVTAGTDGAIYTWNTRTMKREHEHILKSCSYNKATCSPNGRVVYAVGTDKIVKEITDSTVTKEFSSNLMMTQIALSNSGRMLFAGTSAGTIRSLRYPFGDQHDYQEHQAHCGPVTHLKVSSDDQFLFSGSQDGCVYIFRLTDKEERNAKKDKIISFADEILITRSDLEEKTVLMAEIQRQLDELKLEHEYQLRLRDMNFNEKLKELTENFSQEIETLKISSAVLRTEKEKEDVKHQEQFHNLKAKHMSELHDLDIKYNGELMSEYEKYHVLQEKANSLQEKWQRQMREVDASTQKALAELQSVAEAKLNLKIVEIQRLMDVLKEQESEFNEMNKQNQDDIDTELQGVTGKYEKKLRVEREEGARLKGENGIMRKKFETLNKDIEDNRAEIQRMKENAKKLEGVISTLEKEILNLRKEVGLFNKMSDRDDHIQDKERKVYDLKKRNQELEKYKFVLDYRIKELKEQVEPRENHITDMNHQISNIKTELKRLNSQKKKDEQLIATYNAMLLETKNKSVKEHRRSQKIARYSNTFRNDLAEVVRYFQEADMLKKMVKNLYQKYGSKKRAFSNGFEAEVKNEFTVQQEKLKSKIQNLRMQNDSQMLHFRTQTGKAMAKNQDLIREINTTRFEFKTRKIKDTVTEVSLPKLVNY